MDRQNELHAHSLKDASERQRLVDAHTVLSNNGALKGLSPRLLLLLNALDDCYTDFDGVADGDRVKVLLHEALLDVADEVHMARVSLREGLGRDYQLLRGGGEKRLASDKVVQLWRRTQTRLDSHASGPADWPRRGRGKGPQCLHVKTIDVDIDARPWWSSNSTPGPWVLPPTAVTSN